MDGSDVDFNQYPENILYKPLYTQKHFLSSIYQFKQKLAIMKISPAIQNLKQLVEGTTGSENVIGTILEHPEHGRAVLVDIDRRNDSCTVWYEKQTEGLTGFRTLLYSLEDHKIVSEPSIEKQRAAMNALLS